MPYSTPFIIFVGGPSGAGKTTLARMLSEHYRVPCVSEDSYFRGAKNPNENIDQPSAVDHTLLSEHLKKLKSNDSIEQPTYDHSTLSRKSETLTVKPDQIIIIEGMFLFSNPEIRKLCDFGVYVHAPQAICLGRRMVRDEKERAVSPKQTIKYYKENVSPGFFQYVEPGKKSADYIFDNSKEPNLQKNFESLTSAIDAEFYRISPRAKL